jgi:hypothetical protein
MQSVAYVVVGRVTARLLREAALHVDIGARMCVHALADRVVVLRDRA